MFSLGLVQLTSTADRAENWAQVERWVKVAAERGAHMVALPECFSYLGPEKGALEGAQAQDGPLGQALGALARECGIWLLAGGMPERSSEVGRIYNTALLLNDRGEKVAAYRKIHLFDVDIPGGISLRESKTYLAGNDVVFADTPWGRIGLTICYDLRFPELFRKLTLGGTKLVLVPSAFTEFTGKDHWRVLLQARAIENGIYVAAPAQFGAHGNRRRSFGRSLVVDPWGQIVAEASDRPGVIIAEIDFEYQTQVRQRLPCLEHIRLM